MDVLWTVIGVVLIVVALLFVVDAFRQRTVAARIAALLVLVAGVILEVEFDIETHSRQSPRWEAL